MKWVALGAASIAFGALAQWAHVPAAWLIAPMIVAIIVSVMGFGLRLPRWSLVPPQGIVALTISQAFNIPILTEIVHEWFPVLIVVVATVGAAGTAGWILARYSPLSPATAAWGSSPGAAVTMIALCGDYGADPRIVAFMQYLRQTFVILSASLVAHVLAPHQQHGALAIPGAGTAPFVPLPFVLTVTCAIVAAALGRSAMRVFPGGQFLLPLGVGIVVHTTGLFPIDIPWWLLAAAYITVGWTIGLLYTRETLVFVAKMLPTLILSTCVLLAMCGLSAVLLVVLVHTDPLTAYLATTPGGLDSVAIIALGSGTNVALIFAIQVLRLFAVVASGPPLAKAIGRLAITRRERTQTSPA